MNFASGDIPFLVKKSDLKSEISAEEAQNLIADLTADFVLFHSGNSTSMDKVLANIKDSQSVFQPIIDMYLLEGSKHFNSAEQWGGDEQSKCEKCACATSSPWAQKAALFIASDSSITKEIKVTNQ